MKQSGAFLEALGYEVKRDVGKLASGKLVPTLTMLSDADHRDQLWIIETPIPVEDLGADPLSVPFVATQVHEEDRNNLATDQALEDLLGDEVFGAQDAPRYVLVMGLTSCVLARRDKWPSRSVLRFDLTEILTTRNDETLTALIGLIGREALVPQSGTPMLEAIEEEAQRRANAVTTSLKATVREAIEILGTEVLKVTENKLPAGKYPEGYGNPGTWITGDILATESLRMMYRLLFLFYAEANPRLGIFDMKNPTYRTGYSLEALRELESVRLRTKEEKEGTYLWQSLTRLLDIIWNGVDHGPMPCRPVRVSLLDPESTPLLNRVMPRNEAVQKILRALSLKSTRFGTNRISHAQLGIGQLGAVYETLISFTGTVAKEPMLELVPDAKVGKHDLKGISDHLDDTRDDKEYDPLEPAWFVPKSRADEFSRPQIRYHKGHPVIHERGSFTYRLAGRDRQKSASYYTPEPLARLLVKHTLEEACKPYRHPEGTYMADKLLELKILEPAMGSAAFLVETVNQLADMYLDAKHAEIGKTIPQDDYEVQKRRVRAYIADRNCFGVDLNPIAVELGAISLWLNSLHAGSFSPWFGDQLHAGNSLIGARRATYDPKSLKTKKKGERWFELNPHELRPNDTRAKGHVWQFLLPAEGMVPFDKDKSIADLVGDAQEKIKEWRTGPKGAAARRAKKDSGDVDWLDPLTADEVAQLQRLSSTVDDLFDQVADQLRQARAKANDQITLWPETTMPGATGLSYKDKIKDFRVLTGVEHVANSLPYPRKASMAACGVNVRGRRSNILRINYRTTEEIRRWAVAIMTGQQVDDMDVATETAKGYRSLMHGPEPLVAEAASKSDEIAKLIDWVKTIALDARTVGICTYSRTQQDDLRDQLLAAGFAPDILEGEGDVSYEPGIKLLTMHRSKGLEFDAVCLMFLGSQDFPPQWLSTADAFPDDAARQDEFQRLRSLVHVAATRARAVLRISLTGQFFKELIDETKP